MAVKKTKSSALGANPLSQGIFSRTEQAAAQGVPPAPAVSEATQESTSKSLDSRKNKVESINQKQESRFLEKGEREAVNLRLPIELNDWLNDLLRQGKRRHGSKIPKEVWVQAALELFRVLPVDWSAIDSEETLREAVKNLESSFKKQDFGF